MSVKKILKLNNIINKLKKTFFLTLRFIKNKTLKIKYEVYRKTQYDMY